MLRNSISIDQPYSRCTTVRNLLRPILRSQDISAGTVPSLGRRREITVAAWHFQNGVSYRDWFFNTRCRGIWGQYFEEWTTDADEGVWHMNQTCLHLFHVTAPRIPEEIVALHCEPKQTDGSYESSLKRGPHVHVRADKNRLAHAHIPLNLGHLDATLASCDTLTDAIRVSIMVLAQEVIKPATSWA
jgi:hypothetical protein